MHVKNISSTETTITAPTLLPSQQIEIEPTKQKRKYNKKKSADLVPSAQLPKPIHTDISAMRIPTNYGERFAVKKLLVTVPVKKPNKSTFVRVHDGDDWEFMGFIYEDKVAGETYLLSAEVADVVSESVRAVKLHVGVERRGNPMLIPVPLPGEDGRRNPWHDSLMQAVERAKSKWIRIVANMAAGSYDLLGAQGSLSEPIWPTQTMLELVEIGFRGKIISTLSHPVIKELLGQE